MVEIERKFLVLNGSFKSQATNSYAIKQGYLSRVPERVVRVRTKGDKGYITIKGKGSDSGMSRFEWEHEISVKEAEALLQLCEEGIIDKTRYIIPVANHIFEVDEFHGDLDGRILAEIELTSEDEVFERPDWLGEEVTGNPAYYNSTMINSKKR